MSKGHVRPACCAYRSSRATLSWVRWKSSAMTRTRRSPSRSGSRLTSSTAGSYSARTFTTNSSGVSAIVGLPEAPQPLLRVSGPPVHERAVPLGAALSRHLGAEGAGAVRHDHLRLHPHLIAIAQWLGMAGLDHLRLHLPRVEPLSAAVAEVHVLVVDAVPVAPGR